MIERQYFIRLEDIPIIQVDWVFDEVLDHWFSINLSEKKVKFFIKLHNKEELSSDWKVLWRKIWTNSEYGGGETSGILQDEGPPADSLPVSVIKPLFAAGRSRIAGRSWYQWFKDLQYHEYPQRRGRPQQQKMWITWRF